MNKIFKRTFFIVAVMLLFCPGLALADWSVTVTWTPSIGPDLASESVLYDDAEQCSITAGDPATCNFVLAELGGSVVVRSYNTQGVFVDTDPVAVNNQPAPATGVNVHVTYVAP